MTYVPVSDSVNKPHVAGYLLPIGLRNFVRSRETGVVAVAVMIGLISGVLVATISELSGVAHALLFDIPFDAHLSATGVISWQRTLLIPTLGGAILAIVAAVFAGRLKGQFADAIEANALYGGRVAMRGSLLISIQTLLSNGFGGSVGLEAGYTQICAAFSSQIGKRLAARRSDMRLLVACGAAGAISAAFSAPLAGAFYAFEVVLGAYTSAGLVPVIASAVASWLVARHLTQHAFLMVPGFPSPVSVEMIGQTVLIGIICAFASMIVMLAVAFSERCFQRLSIFNGFLRPVLGGAMLGTLALLTPTVLGCRVMAPPSTDGRKPLKIDSRGKHRWEKATASVTIMLANAQMMPIRTVWPIISAETGEGNPSTIRKACWVRWRATSHDATALAMTGTSPAEVYAPSTTSNA